MTHLADIGRAMMIYADDCDGEFPRAGGPGASWAARIPNWLGRDRLEAFGVDPNGAVAGQASISASLYLLVKHVQEPPKAFVCKTGEPKTKPFDPALYGVRDKKLSDLRDFGPSPPRHVSYAYHMVYGPHKVTMASDPNTAILADRNPWMDAPFAKAADFSKFTPGIAPFNGTTARVLKGNALAHQGDGQNVLFVDGHAAFEKRSYCSAGDDNIYTSWNEEDRIRSKPARFGRMPADQTDCLLVNDPAGPWDVESVP